MNITNQEPTSDGTLARAFNELASGNLAEVLSVCELLQKNETAQFLRGLVHDFLGRRCLKEGKKAAKKDFEKAILDYSNVINARKSHLLHTAYGRRAKLLIALERYDEALSDLNKLITREPWNLQAVLEKGLSEMLSGNKNNAIDDFDSVLKKDPSNVQALEWRGQVGLEVFNYPGALHFFREGKKYCEEELTAIRLSLMEALALYLHKQYHQAVALMQGIESQLSELDDNAGRDLQLKFELLRQYFPLKLELLQQDRPAEKEAKEQREEIKSIFVDLQVPAKERCDNFFKWLSLWLHSQNRRRRNMT